MKRIRVWRWVGGALALFLCGGIAAPFLSADRFANRIRLGLEQALGRKVEIGEARFNLFRGPGFTVEDVVIQDDPAFGMEPFAWVGSLEANPSLLALLQGDIRFSSLRLGGDTVVNLVKRGDRWNFERLLTEQAMSKSTQLAVRGARLNFRFEDTRSVFYVTNLDLDASAPWGGEGEWNIEFTGEPSRTDRVNLRGGGARGLGTFAGSGRLRYSPSQPGWLDMDLELERSALGEMTALVYGRDIGLHGIVSSRLRVKGPVDKLEINGRVNVEELHRWDQMPMWGESWPVPVRGILNLQAQQLQIESHKGSGPELPFAVQFRAANYLSRPEWSVGVRWTGFQIEPLVPIARHMGLQVPSDWTVTGITDGEAGYATNDPLHGTMTLHETAISFAGEPAVKFGETQVIVGPGRVRMMPVRVEPPAGTSAGTMVEAEYEWGLDDLDVRLTSTGVAVSALPLRGAQIPAPFFESLRSGVWRGALRYQRRRGVELGWTGQVYLSDASLGVPGIDGAVELSTATLKVSGTRLAMSKMEGTAGEVEFTGSYEWNTDGEQPDSFRIQVASANAADLEAAFGPTLSRPESFLRRALRLGRAPVPTWLMGRESRGNLKIGSLALGPMVLRNIQAGVVWKGGTVEARNLKAQLDTAGTLSGVLGIDLRTGSPEYQLSAVLDGYQWHGSSVGADFAVGSRGLGLDLLRNLHAEGSFQGHAFEIESIDGPVSLAGCFRWQATQPQLRLTDLLLTSGRDLYIGSGITQPDGRLLLQFAAGARKMRVTGTLAELRAERLEAAAAVP